MIPALLVRLAAGLATAVERRAAQAVFGETAFGELAESLGLDKADEELEIEIPVSSEAISSIGYHSDTITVTFHRGGSKVYEFPGTQAEFIAFAMAPSKGRHFNEHFKDR